MLSLKELSSNLKEAFDLKRPFTRLDGQMNCYTFSFRSRVQGVSRPRSLPFLPEEKALIKGEARENHQFRYAVFAPSGRSKSMGAIVLLHGLNERNWEKYLPWAYELSLRTSKPVILFPIAHHMNRAPMAWGVPRPMHQLAALRRRHLGNIANSSFVNAAISCRLDNAPELFVTSGMQSLIDLISLAAQIKEGNHPLFGHETHVDFFSYSIGAFITEILLMANPMGLFSDSKAFFFCGGATFDLMDGRSKSILDDRAFGSLVEFVKTLQKGYHPVINFPDSSKPWMVSLWDAFLSMLNSQNHRSHREKALRKLVGKIAAIGLKIDRVIPGGAIQKTLARSLKDNHHVLVEHFNYPYTHEAPFPLKNSKFLREVQQAFSFTFQKAGSFLG